MDNNALNLKTHKILEYKGSNYLFISDTASLFEIDEDLKKAIDSENNIFHTENLNNKDEIIRSLDKAGFLKDSFREPDLLGIIEEQDPTALVLMLSQNCNLRCTYCYAGDGEYSNKGFMDKEIAKKAIDYVFMNYDNDRITLILFGGEPLLNIELFEYCIEYGKLKAKETNKSIAFSTTTNATLLNSENSKLIRDNNFAVTISIDGDKETHNKNRFDVNRQGTYDRVVEKINKYLGTRNISARATLTKHNPNIKEIYEHLYKLGFGSIHISPSIEFMDGNAYEELTMHYINLIEEFRRRLNEKDYEYCIKMSNLASYLQRIHSGGLRRKFCGAYNNMITVDIDGKIYGCHRFVSNPPFYYGKANSDIIIDDKKKNEYIQLMVKDINSPCQDCWILGLCGGGCPAENLNATGDVTKPHGLTCEHLRQIMPEVIRLYLDLTNEQKDILFRKNEGKD